jgi:hypothetical protein
MKNSPGLRSNVRPRRVRTYPLLPDVTTPNCEALGRPGTRNPRRFPVRHETFSRDLRCAVMQPDIWYVAYGPDKTLKTNDSADAALRSTRTFKSEVDAKLFAMQILAKGWSASAGTLNPHQPKQTVGSSQIESWADPGLGG